MTSFLDYSKQLDETARRVKLTSRKNRNVDRVTDTDTVNLQEMPAPLAIEIGWDGEERSEAVDVKENADFVETITLRGVDYLHYVQQQDEYQSHSFLTSDGAELAARHSFRLADDMPGLVPAAIRKDGIQTGTIWNSARHKSVIRAWFAERIMTSYRCLISDEFQTIAGLRFWKKLVAQYSDRQLFVYDSKTKKLQSIKADEMDLFYALKDKNKLFVLCKS